MGRGERRPDLGLLVLDASGPEAEANTWPSTCCELRGLLGGMRCRSQSWPTAISSTAGRSPSFGASALFEYIETHRSEDGGTQEALCRNRSKWGGTGTGPIRECRDAYCGSEKVLRISPSAPFLIDVFRGSEAGGRPTGPAGIMIARHSPRPDHPRA